jgi:hypothetical protein
MEPLLERHSRALLDLVGRDAEMDLLPPFKVELRESRLDRHPDPVLDFQSGGREAIDHTIAPLE